MPFEESFKNWKNSTNLSDTEFMNIAKAVLQVYPMIVLANLSKNTYTMIRNDGFLYNAITSSGCYDELIDDNIGNIHPNYQKLFMNAFQGNIS